MKLNTKNTMKSSWEVEEMNINWRSKDGCTNTGMPRGKRLKSKNSRHAYNRHLKNKWKKIANKLTNEEIIDLNHGISNIGN